MNISDLRHQDYRLPAERLAIVIRDTLNVPESTMFIGRDNLTSQDFNAPVISVEQSGNSEVKGFTEVYDGQRENTELSQCEKILFDVNFWGGNAVSRAQIFLRMLRTQQCHEQQWKNNISLYAPSGVRDLHFATGSQYRERALVTVTAYVSDHISVRTPSIEILSLQLSTEKGKKYE